MEDIASKWERLFGMRPDTMPTEKLLAIQKACKNPHIHHHQDLAALEGSIDKAGFKNIILLWQNDQGQIDLVYGGGRIMAGAEKGYEELPIVWATDFDLIKARFLRLADNRVPQLAPKYDDNQIIADLKYLKDASLELEFLKFDKYDKFLINDLAASDPLFEEIAPGYAERVNGPVMAPEVMAPLRPLPLGTQEPQIHPPLPPVDHSAPLEKVQEWHGRPAIAYPSDNEYGIPTLSTKYQADNVPYPVDKWGEIGRGAKTAGLWHFYVEDEKFKGLIKDPNAPLMGKATACCEPNYSIHPEDPLAVVLWWTYWKRWLARYWQSKGINIFVDLWVAGKYRDINLLGVPDGWRSYSIRGNSGLLPYLEVMYVEVLEKAKRGGTEIEDVLYLVYGGGQATQDACHEYGWTWIPERMQVVSNPELAGWDGRDNVVPFDDYNKTEKT